MNPRALRRFYVLSAVVALVTALVVAALMQPIFGTRTDFSIYNTRWNGASTLAADVYGTGSLVPAFNVDTGTGEDVTIVHRSFAEYDLDPRASSVLVLGPGAGPTPAETAWLRAFLDGGGRVILADDFGAGNAFLRGLGSESRFHGGLMMDLAFTKKPEFVVAAAFEPHPLTRDVTELVLDYATALEPGPNATVIAWSSASAWIDGNGNVYRDEGDAVGPFPLLAVEPVGAGELVLLSDPSVLINGMRPLAGNDAFAGNVAAWLTEDARATLIDESHREYFDPVSFLGVRLRALPASWRLALVVAAMGAFLATTVLDTRRVRERPLRALRRVVDRLLPPPPPAEVDLVARVRERHPDWEESDLRRILSDWERAR